MSLDAAVARSDLDTGLIWCWCIMDCLYSVALEPIFDVGLPAVGEHLTSVAGLWFWLLLCCICSCAPYAAFQKHALPRLLGKWVGRCYFWPCVPCSVIGNQVEFKGEWYASVDEEQPAVLLGQAPLFASYMEVLEGLGVKAVINLCDEFKGPTRTYRRNGVSLLWLRTVDHLEPTVEAMRTACSFIEHHRKRGSGVYIHCKSGRGRSAAVAMAWLMHHRKMDVMAAQKQLLSVRKVRAKLYKQKNIIQFHSECVGGGGGGGDDDELGGRTLSYATPAPKNRRRSKSRAMGTHVHGGLGGRQSRFSAFHDSAWAVSESPPAWDDKIVEIIVAPLENVEEQEAVASMRRETARNKAEQTAEQRHREGGEGDAERGDAGEPPLKVFRF